MAGKRSVTSFRAGRCQIHDVTPAAFAVRELEPTNRFQSGNACILKPQRLFNVCPWNETHPEKGNMQKMHIAFHVARTEVIDAGRGKRGERGENALRASTKMSLVAG
jgi:hypothetical protein